jgi:hypothetical protein
LRQKAKRCATSPSIRGKIGVFFADGFAWRPKTSYINTFASRKRGKLREKSAEIREKQGFTGLFFSARRF